MSAPKHRSSASAGLPSWFHLRGWSRRAKLISAVFGALLAGGVAFAATSWTVGLDSGSSGQAKAGSVTTLSIVAVASPSPTNLLYPGGTGDVIAKITNNNNVAVTLTAVNLPLNTTYAAGYSDSALQTAATGCTATTSAVAWNYATATSGSSHTLTTPITLPANGYLNVTFTNDAAMGNSAALACQNTYFSMPSLTGVSATAGVATPSGASGTNLTDSWTS